MVNSTYTPHFFYETRDGSPLAFIGIYGVVIPEDGEQFLVSIFRNEKGVVCLDAKETKYSISQEFLEDWVLPIMKNYDRFIVMMETRQERGWKPDPKEFDEIINYVFQTA